ncbi:hypothetical protein HYPSUDRAFT_208629 [Hypholoma sublateritium FD-334 SS-4]|uniref:Uncharacterized protein n=1 Tax=Hypholoma sublateritium (strain FD-334 SS-4) TaxID=945553 RepID=A0A0D2ND73_HYPSF|nr:hypothetical protein HYPSUDRAFT_208629 [Hypholoma sublateritium FD-334 SS-4]
MQRAASSASTAPPSPPTAAPDDDDDASARSKPLSPPPSQPPYHPACSAHGPPPSSPRRPFCLRPPPCMCTAATAPRPGPRRAPSPSCATRHAAATHPQPFARAPLSPLHRARRPLQRDARGAHGTRETLWYALLSPPSLHPLLRPLMRRMLQVRARHPLPLHIRSALVSIVHDGPISAALRAVPHARDPPPRLRASGSSSRAPTPKHPMDATPHLHAWRFLSASRDGPLRDSAIPVPRRTSTSHAALWYDLPSSFPRFDAGARIGAVSGAVPHAHDLHGGGDGTHPRVRGDLRVAARIPTQRAVRVGGAAFACAGRLRRCTEPPRRARAVCGGGGGRGRAAPHSAGRPPTPGLQRSLLSASSRVTSPSAQAAKAHAGATLTAAASAERNGHTPRSRVAVGAPNTRTRHGIGAPPPSLLPCTSASWSASASIAGRASCNARLAHDPVSILARGIGAFVPSYYLGIFDRGHLNPFAVVSSELVQRRFVARICTDEIEYVRVVADDLWTLLGHSPAVHPDVDYMLGTLGFESIL